MTGHAGSLELLTDHLDNIDDWDTYIAAFQGLRFITGMDFIPQFDPDEAEPEEVTEYKNIWSQWLEKNQSNFSERFKWRRGEKVSPEVLYKDLNWIGNPCRDMSYLEMVLRYNCPENFQFDNFYEVQYSQLKSLRNWINKKNTMFQPGLLYYKGNPVK